MTDNSIQQVHSNGSMASPWCSGANMLGNFFIKWFSVGASNNYTVRSFILGICCFGINLLLYAKALKTISRAIVYPNMIGMTMNRLTLLGVFAFRERFTARDVLGLVFVVAGVALFSRAL